MFNKKKKENIEEVAADLPATVSAPVEEVPAPAPAKPLPPLPACDGLAAGVIAIVFATIGVIMCMNVVKEANPKEKKPKKPKKDKKKKAE